MNDKEVLTIESIDVYYGGLRAVRNVSLKVYEGEIVALVGANGAGKSTTLKAASGLIRPSCGTIKFEGENITHADPSWMVNAGISHVPQGRRIFPDMSVIDNLMLGSFTRKARQKKNENLKAVYELFPILESRKKQQGKTLSGGEQQMLALGRGLMSDPRLMYIDEMSLGLAPIVIGRIYKVLHEIRKKGITIVFVEQSVRRSLQEADRAYIMEAGRIVMSGSVSDLREEEEIRKAYFGI